MRLSNKNIKKISAYGATPILQIRNSVLTQYEAAQLAESLISEGHYRRTPIIVNAPETELQYIRYASPKRMRLLKYGKLRTQQVTDSQQTAILADLNKYT
jgi:hypothetical protein